MSDAPVTTPPTRSSKMLRLAIILAILGLSCLALFLAFGFLPWTVGLGMFIGMPLLLVSIIIYIIAVVRDLRKRGAL